MNEKDMIKKEAELVAKISSAEFREDLLPVMKEIEVFFEINSEAANDLQKEWKRRFYSDLKDKTNISEEEFDKRWRDHFNQAEK